MQGRKEGRHGNFLHRDFTTLHLSSHAIAGLSPVDRAAIVAVDDVDELAIASGESRGVGEGEGRGQAQQQGRL